jgi:hypothetical protein
MTPWVIADNLDGIQRRKRIGEHCPEFRNIEFVRVCIEVTEEKRWYDANYTVTILIIQDHI